MFHFPTLPSITLCPSPKARPSSDDLQALTCKGFPIQRSADHRIFAPTRSLSQLITSFIDFWHQGIHHKPLSSSFEVPAVTRFEIFSRACRTLMTPSRIGFVCLILVCLSWKLCFPQNCWSISFAFSLGLAPSSFSVLLMSVICATRMSICSQNSLT